MPIKVVRCDRNQTLILAYVEGALQGFRLNPCTAPDPRTPAEPTKWVPGWIGIVPVSSDFTESPTPEKNAVARPRVLLPGE